MGMVAYFKVLEDNEYELIESNPECVEDILFPLDGEDAPFYGQLCLEKDWHAIHYILTSTLEPDGSAIADAVLGGEEIGPNLGYGSARLIRPNRVQEISDALINIDIAEKISEIDTESPQLNEIYGGISTEALVVQSYKDFFRELDNMYGSASKDKKAVLAYWA